MALARKESQELAERRVLEMAADIESEMDLSWLTIIHKFDPRNSEDRVLCETNTDWEYRQASMLWNVQIVCATSDEELSDTIIHELIHVLIDPLWSVACKVKGSRRLNEFSVECVARAIKSIRSHQ